MSTNGTHIILISMNYEPLVIEVLMRKREYTQEKLGKEVGIPQALLSQMIRGKKRMKAETRQQISSLLGVYNPDSLFEVYDPSKKAYYLSNSI